MDQCSDEQARQGRSHSALDGTAAFMTLCCGQTVSWDLSAVRMCNS